MNWLAHTFLSTHNVEFRLGNLLADVVRGTERERLGVEFARGAHCHKQIDAFTDSHPVVRASRARVSAQHRRFAGVLIDVFYDYFLANEWERYSSEPLAAFTTAFYRDVGNAALELPPDARVMIDRIVRYDSLGSYVEVAGVERALKRISTYLAQRWRREFALEASVADLRTHEAGFAADFAEFFPALQAHVKGVIAASEPTSKPVH